MHVVIDGLMTNYQKVGGGKNKIILLHGWGTNASSFDGLTQALKAKYTYYALDMPGFGGTEPPSLAWGLENYAQFVASWLKKLKIKKPFAVVGHSFGGSVAITATGKDFLNTSHLILLASAGIRDKDAFRKSGLKLVAKAGKQGLYLLPTAQRHKVRGKFYRTIGSDMALLPHMEETFKKTIGEDVSAAAAAIKVPTLLVYGSQDKATPLEDGWVLHQLIAGSQLEVVDSNHFLHESSSEEVARLIKVFLEAKK